MVPVPITIMVDPIIPDVWKEAVFEPGIETVDIEPAALVGPIGSTLRAALAPGLIQGTGRALVDDVGHQHLAVCAAAKHD